MATPLTKVARLIERLSKELRITPRQTEVLLTVYELKSVTLDDLADLYNLRPGTVGKHVLKLMQKGWVEQHDDVDYDLFIVDRVNHDEFMGVLKHTLNRLKFTTMRLEREHRERQKELDHA